jgi:hypothetical protein
MRDGTGSGRRSIARGATGVCALALTLLALAPTAQADPPSHGRAPILDVSGLNHACGLAVDSKGDLYASSAGAGEVKVYNPSHAELTSISNSNEPCGLAVDSKGTLYVSEKATGKVVKYKPNKYPFEGTPTYEGPTTVDPSGKARGISVDRTDDRLYVAEGNRVAVYDSKGKLGVDEVQTVNVSGCTSGTFKLKFKGKETIPLACAATAVEVKAALTALTTIGAGNVEVEKPVNAHRVTFVGALASTDVPMLEGDASLLVPAKITIAEATRGFNGFVGEGSLTNATGVAAYTYIYTEGPVNLKRHYYLGVADDAATDQVRIFTAREGSALKLRRTITGVDEDENPETEDQGFGFGPSGAPLAADPGNESRETRKCTQVQVEAKDQACTQGHLFLYDAANGAVDEFDASGEFVDQVTNGSFEDAKPTALAVERSGAAGDGTLYVSAGDSSGAKALAFRPLGMPGRDPLPALSRVLAQAHAVATDCNGYVYVAAEALVRVYGPEGKALTSFEDAENPSDLAADCEGNVYVVDTEPAEDVLTYYSPSEYPPTPTTSYTRAESSLIPGELGEGPKAVAVNPANQHALVLGAKGISAAVFEFGPVAEGSPPMGECAAGLIGSSGNAKDIDVYGPTGEVYVTANPTVLATLGCEGEGELLIPQIKGGGCPSGEFSANPAIAVDQSNGHVVEFEPGQAGNGTREYDSSGACVAEFGTFSGSTSGYRVAVDSSCALHEPPLTEQTTPKCTAEYPSDGNVYVASDGLNNTEQPYDVNAFGPLEYPPPEGTPAEAVTGNADGFGPGTATLHGTVTPNDTLLECRFEYLTEAEYEDNGENFTGAKEAPCAEGFDEIGNGSKPVSVHADIENLAIDTAYRYRLFAANEFPDPLEKGTGKAKAFILEAPVIVAKDALPVAYDETTLRGEIGLSGSVTEYHFEYLTQTTYEENGETFDGTHQSTPVVALPTGEGTVAVQTSVTGLEEGTEYRFRLLAENAVGPAPPAEGPPFKTLERPAPQQCTNTEYRTGLSAFLPDCRAYELVTPAQMLSTSAGLLSLGTFTSVSGSRFFNSWFVAPRGAGAGESVSFKAMVPRVDNHRFRAQRAAGTHPEAGWASEPYGVTFAQGGGDDGEPGGVSPDQRYSLLEVLAHETPTELAFPVGTYIRVPAGQANQECTPEPEAFALADPEGKFELVGCGDLDTVRKAEGRFVSTGGTHVIFTSDEELEASSPPAGVEAIYDREAGKVGAEVVSTKPGGSPFGAGEEPRYLASTEDGEAVVFSVDGDLYVHRGGETTQVADAPNTYAGISEDGRRVFFMDESFNPAGIEDVPPPSGLFACDAEGGNCAGPLQDQEPIEIASQSDFVNVSADGSNVFFTSEDTEPSEDMELGKNENGEEAETGEPNLFVWDGAATRFVAILDPQDLESFRKGAGDENVENQEDLFQWTNVIPGQLATDSGLYEAGRAYSPTRSTPDGEVLVFQSHARLTGYDNEGKGEIYRYAPAAASGSRLVCVSCDPSGAPHDSIADALFDTVVLGAINSSTMIPNVTDDGKRVFFESREPLLPEDANEANDVYEWKALGTTGPGGDICERPGGCLALISSGQGEAQSYFFGMSADGEDAFFVTQEKLVGADVLASTSIYDARVLGGIPDPPLAEGCQGDACQGQGSPPPALPAPASTGAGTTESPQGRPACAKGKHRVKGRCVRKKHSKPKRHRKHPKKQRASHNKEARR